MTKNEAWKVKKEENLKLGKINMSYHNIIVYVLKKNFSYNILFLFLVEANWFNKI